MNEGRRRWGKGDKAGQCWGREGREKGEKEPKARGLSLSLLWQKQDETLPGEVWGRNACAVGSTDAAGREEHLTERNGRRAREKHRRQKAF